MNWRERNKTTVTLRQHYRVCKKLKNNLQKTIRMNK